MDNSFKQLTDFLIETGIEQVPHTGKTYLAHLIGVYRFMERAGCTAELCRAGMFHSIYGTEQFQGFKLPLESRSALAQRIGARAERLAYLNCAMDRASLDRALEDDGESYPIRDRLTGEEVTLTRADFEDLCRVHLFDWLEQAPRSRLGWEYRRSAYRRMAQRLGPAAAAAYEQVFAQEPSQP
ncbi:MAG: hypothetical protein L0215_09515 [Gemmataceae bacterium]|nr:hypothetical protein [Gemmataceae bacterium]